MNQKVNDFIALNYYELLKIAKKITKEKGDIHKELLHEVILQLYEKDDIILRDYEDKSIKYYITAIMRINYYSKTSPFYYKIRKHNQNISYDLNLCLEIEEEQNVFETEEIYTLLEENYSELSWFHKDLLSMYLSLNSSMKAVSRKTTIPIQSISRYIKEARQQVKTNVIKGLYE